jgi:hypothetical protein
LTTPFNPDIIGGMNSLLCTAFCGFERIAAGPLLDVAVAAKERLDREPGATLLVFDDETGRQIELDLRGSAADVARRLRRTGDRDQPAVPRSAGRPKLGVVAREVTLLPRHWEWLSQQPGGASVALRKLVEEARRTNAGRDRVRNAQEVAYRFTSAIAGDLPGYEEATRALFAGDRARFEANIEAWPADVGGYARKLAADAFVEAGLAR